MKDEDVLNAVCMLEARDLHLLQRAVKKANTYINDNFHMPERTLTGTPIGLEKAIMSVLEDTE